MIRDVSHILVAGFLVLGTILAGCIGIQEEAVNDESGLPPLTVATTIQIFDHNATESWQNLTWVLEPLEERMDGYGTDQELAPFRAETFFGSRTVYYDPETRDMSVKLNKHERGEEDLSARGQECYLPEPLDLLVLLTGKEVPTHGADQSLLGKPFVMDLVRDGSTLKMSLINQDYRIKADFEPTNAGGRVEVSMKASVEGNSPYCQDPIYQDSDAVIEPGQGEAIHFQSGLSKSPHPRSEFSWPPKEYIPSAAFSLERAVAALENDWHFQGFSQGGAIWPMGLTYHDTACMSQDVTWQWEIRVARDDGLMFVACVVLPKGLEELPVERVVRTEEKKPIRHFDPVEVVDFGVLDTTVTRFSKELAGGLSRFQFEIFPGTTIPWVAIGHEDPDEEGHIFRCDFMASSGRISGCGHYPGWIVYGP